MQLSRNEFFQLVAGASAWLVSSGFAQKIKLAVADAARPLPLTAVRLTGGPLKQAQEPRQGVPPRQGMPPRQEVPPRQQLTLECRPWTQSIDASCCS